MKTPIVRTLLAAAALAFATHAAAQKPCTKADETNAGKAIDRITSWSQLSSTWKTWRHCDVPPNSELFTEAILRLVIDWKGVEQLSDAMKDADYKAFILNHLKSPEAKADAPDVYSRAKSKCPRGHDDFCKEIAAAVKEEAPKAAAPASPMPELMPSIRPSAPAPAPDKK